MYRKAPKGWLKHFDFIILDCICLELAFIIGYTVRHKSWFSFQDELYLQMSVMLLFMNIFVGFFCESYKDIRKRGYLYEFKAVRNHFIYLVFVFRD